MGFSTQYLYMPPLFDLRERREEISVHCSSYLLDTFDILQWKTQLLEVMSSWSMVLNNCKLQQVCYDEFRDRLCPQLEELFHVVWGSVSSVSMIIRDQYWTN